MLKVKVKIEPPSTDLSPIRPTAIHESFAGDLGITGKDVTGIVFSIVNGQHVNNAHYQVRTLEPGMLGYLSNVQDGDIIYAIDGRTFPDNAEMQRYIQSLPIGSVAQVSTSRHDNPPDDMIVGNGGYYDGFMGLTVKEQLNGAVLKDNDWNDWIATAQVVHMNTTANTHLKVGDIIYAINGNSFPSLKAMSDYMWSQKPGTPLQVDYFSAEDSYRPKGVMLPATESQIHARIDNHNWWSAARDYAELGIAAVAVVVAVIYAKPAVPSMPAIPGITPGVPAAPGAPPIGFH
jgi:C-terminal processing protease CtpA/Prc